MIPNLDDALEVRKVAIYIRVSTEEQKIAGYGLDAQKKRLNDFVTANAAHGWQTKKEWLYEDTHTGSDLNRPELTRLRDDVKKGKFDAVLVWKIDRLSRSLKHLILVFEEMQQNNVSFVSVQENIDFKGPIGNLVFQIFGAIAQFERALIKGRTMMGKIMSAEMGNYTGTSIPYAYRKVPNLKSKGSVLEIIPDEKEWVCQIYDWYIFEGLGEGQIAKQLNKLKVPKTNHQRTKRASVQWTHVMVRTILTNSLYRGEFLANKKDDEGNVLPEDQWTIVAVPCCVSEFTFAQAREARRYRKGGTTNTDYLLTSKLKDMDLEKPKGFSGAKRTKGGFSYRRKQFDKTVNGRQKHYQVFEVPGKQIEDYVWAKVMEALKKPDVFIKKYLSKQYAEPSVVDRLQRDLMTCRAARINEELAIARIESAFEEGKYSEEKMAEKTQERNMTIQRLDQQIADAEEKLAFMSSVNVEVQKLKDAAAQVQYRLEKLDRKQKKILCDLFVDRVEMRRRKVHNRWKIHADVFFRFNPQKFSEAVEEGRTKSRLGKAPDANPGGQNAELGGR